MSSKESMEMEVDNSAPTDGVNNPVEVTEKNVMAGGAVGSVTCSLHPLVIMNVSEHWTREKAQEGSVQQVIGALIGKQKGRNIEIMNSFELVFTMIGGDVIIDRDYYNMKEEQCTINDYNI
jgi:COP9 signalosome complex subunit 6